MLMSNGSVTGRTLKNLPERLRIALCDIATSSGSLVCQRLCVDLSIIWISEQPYKKKEVSEI